MDCNYVPLVSLRNSASSNPNESRKVLKIAVVPSPTPITGILEDSMTVTLADSWCCLQKSCNRNALSHPAVPPPRTTIFFSELDEFSFIKACWVRHDLNSPNDLSLFAEAVCISEIMRISYCNEGIMSPWAANISSVSFQISSRDSSAAV